MNHMLRVTLIKHALSLSPPPFPTRIRFQTNSDLESASTISRCLGHPPRKHKFGVEIVAKEPRKPYMFRVGGPNAGSVMRSLLKISYGDVSWTMSRVRGLDGDCSV
jgi:hypothetical protein